MAWFWLDGMRTWNRLYYETDRTWKVSMHQPDKPLVEFDRGCPLVEIHDWRGTPPQNIGQVYCWVIIMCVCVSVRLCFERTLLWLDLKASLAANDTVAGLPQQTNCHAYVAED